MLFGRSSKAGLLAKQLVLLVLTGLTSTVSVAGSALLNWTAPVTGTDGLPITDPLTYRAYYRCGAGSGYPNSTGTIVGTSYTVTALPDVGTCFFVVRAISSSGVESAYSNEASKVMGILSPPGKAGLSIQWAEGNEMAIAFDAHSVSGAAPGVDPSWTHTPVGTPRGALVYILHPTSETITSVTYGGAGLSSVATVVASGGNEWAGYSITAYFLGSSLPTGAQTIAINNDALDIFAYAYTVTAAANTEFIDDANAESTSISNVTATLALGGRSCFCSEAFASGEDDVASLTPLTSWTSRTENDFGTFTAGSYSYDTIGTTDVTAGLTQSTDDILLLAIALSEVVTGAYNAVPLLDHYERMIAGR